MRQTYTSIYNFFAPQTDFSGKSFGVSSLRIIGVNFSSCAQYEKSR